MTRVCVCVRCPQLSGWTSNLVDIVMAHHFSTVRFPAVLPEAASSSLKGRLCLLQDELTGNQELIQTYRLHIAQDINQENLALFCGAYQ